MTNDIGYYCVGFIWDGGTDSQLERFIKQGIWENGFNDKYIDKVKSIEIGSKLAAKTSYTRKLNGKTISVLAVYGIGTVTENPQNGKILKVEWEKNFHPFTIDGRGAYRSTISKVNHKENIDLIFGKKKNKEGEALNYNPDDLQDLFPLNQILFGPPGTGKTYTTINKVVSIVDGIKENKLNVYYEDRETLKERFDELLIQDWDSNDGNVAFITFHQSLSYEDFIEGIKPLISEDENVYYDVIPGVFRRIASLAMDNWLDSKKGKKGQFSFDEAFFKLKEKWEEDNQMKFPMKTEGKEFTVTGFTKYSIKFKKANGGTAHSLSIATLQDYYYQKKEIRKTGIGIYYPGILEKLSENKPVLEIEKEERKYVLVIDEINRGNVSQIFGELITLIEEDKRMGKTEALEVTLPYSKEKFSVPPNLYIVGTMNTADRSVEALDTALRRRFSFIEMMPDYNLIEKIKDINLAGLLRTINNRLCYLINEDHQIGHSYFMDITTDEKLKDVFKNKIIPLLKEYFYNDASKIQLILGEGFVKKNAIKKPKFAIANNEVMDKDTYSIIEIDEKFDIAQAIIKIGSFENA